MSPKLSVEIDKWTDGRLNWLKIKRRRQKPLKLQFLYDSDGLVKEIEFSGKKDEMPSLSEIVELVNASWIERIGTIKQIDTISEITAIDAILSMGDLVHLPKSFIVNPSFEQDDVGWYNIGGVIDDEDGYLSGKCLKIPAATTVLMYQTLPIPLGVDWLTEFYFYLKSPDTLTNLVVFEYYYTDGTNSSEIFQVTVADTWQKKTLSPTAAKLIECLRFYSTFAEECKVDHITTVF